MLLRVLLRPLLFLGGPGQVSLLATGVEYYWPQQKGDVNRTGYSPYPVANDLTVEPSWVWRDPYLDVIRCTPLIDDKKNIYLGTQSGRIWKFDQDGRMLWYWKSPRGNTPTVSSIMDGVLYGNTVSGFVFALDMNTGIEKWTVPISASTAGDTACVFALNGTIISATRQPGQYDGQNNMVVALNTDGSTRWTFKHVWPSFNFQASSPGDGTLVFQDHFGGIYRLGLDDGRLIWESGVIDRQPHFFTTGATIVGPNGLVYCASNYHNAMGIIHVYRLSDGAPVWRKDMGTQVNQAVAFGKLAGSDRPAVVTGIGENPGYPWVLRLPAWVPLTVKGWINSLSHRAAGWPTWLWQTHVLPAFLVALDAETGEHRWTFTPPPFMRPSCEGDESMLPERGVAASQVTDYVGDSICLPDDWAQAVIGGDGTTYAGHQDGRLYAVRDANGNGKIEADEATSYYFGAAFQGSQGLAPGMLAVAPCGGGLHVFRG
mmetsp:Transcript_118334/g.382000  ORF Transcript_118334/g.382000 Transcript_118334/m.382000 type:complete len:486 (+) Transcript_118334:67-1524(+)